MDRNSIIGFILIGVVLVGFSMYQSRVYRQQEEVQRQIDSAARAEARIAYLEDSVRMAQMDSIARAGGGVDVTLAQMADNGVIYKDSLLSVAATQEASCLTLANDKVEIVFTTKGAQPYSVRIKDYLTHDGSDLVLIRPGGSSLRASVYAGELISTDDFNFQVESVTDSSLVMCLPFARGGMIRQSYLLHDDGYILDSDLAFIGMENVIPSNVSSIDVDWGVNIPRLEKGYKNEKQYSMLNYYFSGENKPEDLGRSRDAAKSVPTKVKWFAFHQQFFSAIMTASDEFSSGDFAVKYYDEFDESGNLMNCTAKMRAEIGRGEGSGFRSSFYFGPNHYATLKAMDNRYEKTIPLGGSLVGWISRFIIIPTFNLLSRFIGSYGLIILIMTFLLKLIISPLTIKSFMSSAKMQAIKPEIDKLNEKYGNSQEDALKKQQATMDLYKRAGINPMGGCLPILFQFPVLWAMFRFFPASIELRQQSFLWCHDLSAYDSILNFGFNIPLFGDHLSLFALLMAVTMFFYSRITSSQMGNDPNMATMKFMNVWLMPIMMLFICNNLSAALSYYYFLSNLFTIAITFVIKKWIVKPEEIRARLAASAGKPAKKSKWQQRLEEIQKQQQAQLKAQKRK